jgi:hypothetical protein
VTNEFCTLFDVNYLPRALVLYRSLAETCSSFHLRAYCMDEQSHALLTRLDLPGVEPVPLWQLEQDDPELAATKAGRTQVEYCWTATPAICLHALSQDASLEAITYLDADLMFFRDPQPLFDELGDDSVLLVPHRFAPEHAHLEPLVGVFNVQFMTFRSDARGLEALRWWRERCLEWCYARHEDGKFGDQKYLDDWPQRFAGVHVLAHPGGGLAPWNVTTHTLTRTDAGLRVDGTELVFFHYHALQLYGGLAAVRRVGGARSSYRLEPGPPAIVWSTGYPIAPLELELLWRPYLLRLGDAVRTLRAVEPGFDAGFSAVAASLLTRQVVRELVPEPVRRRLREARR